MAEDRYWQKDPCAVTTSTPELHRRRHLRFSLSRQQIIGLVWQAVVIGAAVGIVAFLWSNALHNLSVRRISTGFAFLGREAGMPTPGSPIARRTRTSAPSLSASSIRCALP
jgi:general L-amino acid transport system permease protein